MKLKLNILQEHYAFLSQTSYSTKYFRSTTPSEDREIERILKAIEDAGLDDDVDDVFLRDSLSQRQILLLLSSECVKIINLLFILLAYERGGNVFQVNGEDKYSLWLYALTIHPEILPSLRTELGWKRQEDVSNILQNVRVQVQYKHRPRKSQRKRHYTDKGHLPSEQERFRRITTLDEAAEEARSIVEHDRELKDTIEFLVGMLN